MQRVLNAGRVQLCDRYQRPPFCVPFNAEKFIDLVWVLYIVHHLVFDETLWSMILGTLTRVVQLICISGCRLKNAA